APIFSITTYGVKWRSSMAGARANTLQINANKSAPTAIPLFEMYWTQGPPLLYTTRTTGISCIVVAALASAMCPR
ncbi:MAG TPA: hypothetical protein VK140_00495, partial [Ktedonobacteraceae bacterium]|nr:hypothetical protein [Ktedonobacteraceae bacterium]